MARCECRPRYLGSKDVMGLEVMLLERLPLLEVSTWATCHGSLTERRTTIKDRMRQQSAFATSRYILVCQQDAFQNANIMVRLPR